MVSQKTTKTNVYQYYYVAISGPDCEEMFARAGYSKDSPVIKLNDGFVEKLMSDICNTSMELTFSSMLNMRISFLRLLEYLYRKNKQDETPISNKPSLLVESIKQYIDYNYQNEFSISDLSRKMHYTQPYLSRIFKNKTGQTIQEYLISVRMEAARTHLANGRGVAETATLCGYSDACNFSKMFKRVCGVSPAIWREKNEE